MSHCKGCPRRMLLKHIFNIEQHQLLDHGRPVLLHADATCCQAAFQPGTGPLGLF